MKAKRRKSTIPRTSPFAKRKTAKRKTAKRKTAKRTRTDASRLTVLERTVASHAKRLDGHDRAIGAISKAMKGYRK